MPDNPFQTSNAMTQAAEHDLVLDQIAEILRENRIWHIGLGILGVLMAVLMIVVGLFMTVGGAGSAASLGQAGMLSGGFMTAMGVLYGIFGLMYGIPSAMLIRSGLAAMSCHPGVEERQPMIDSLNAQRWFWRFVGVITFLFTGLYAMGILVLCLGALV